MGNASTNIANIQQDFNNNILQSNQQSCTVDNNTSASGNVVIVNGENIGGNATGVNAVSQGTDASCLLASNMGSSVSSILTAALSQTNSTASDWFGGFSFSADTNVFDVNQATTNQINQINESTCSSNNVLSSNNNYVYFTNGTVGGNFVGIGADSGQATASCSMQNTMKSQTYNQAQASNSQGNTEKGMFVSMVGSFAGIIGLIVVLVVIMLVVGAIGFIGYEGYEALPSGKTSTTAGAPGTEASTLEQQENAELALYDQYGGTSFIDDAA